MQINEENFIKYITELSNKIKANGKIYSSLYPIPRGGYKIAIELSKILNIPIITNKENINKNTLIVDDLIDSGKTIQEFNKYDTAVLFIKNKKNKLATYYVQELKQNEWIKFPDEKDNEIEKHIERILQYIGENTSREGLIETPKRMKKAYDEIFAGYKENPKDLMKTFKEGTCNEMVILKNCEFYSTCEHHFLPFFGHISIGYIPYKKVIGISKLARLVDCFSKRMQIQENMTTQIADCIMKELSARGVMVICEAQHFCMKSRGVKKQNASMVTSAIRGVFKDNIALRQEFLSVIK